MSYGAGSPGHKSCVSEHHTSVVKTVINYFQHLWFHSLLCTDDKSYSLALMVCKYYFNGDYNVYGRYNDSFKTLLGVMKVICFSC